MNEFLRSLPADSKEPVQLVCYHPVLDAKLRRGEEVELKALPTQWRTSGAKQ